MHYRRTIHLLFILLLLASGLCISQEKTEKDPLEGLPQFIEKAMKEWKVPGLAVAIVKDGNVIFSEGFGYRDVEKELPVTARTLFPIGSNTKAFTAAAVAILVDEGKLEWDKPVREYLPDFTLHDEFATLHMTPRDLLSHRTGLPRHDLMWLGSDASREELYKRLRYLELNEEPRYVYQYNNFMYMTAGYLIGKISGGTWEEFISARIFKPLGMERSNFCVKETQESDDFSEPYAEDDGKIEKIPFRPIGPMGPAGSINSSVEEMSKWLLLHLNSGKSGEQQIISEASLKQTHTPQVAMQIPGSEELPIATYGMGWVIQPYRGHLLIWHNGGIDGFYSYGGFLPYDKIGIVILTNTAYNNMPEVISRWVFDRLLGLEEIDWNKRLLERFQKAIEALKEIEKNLFAGRKENTSPTLPITEYAGDYENPGYGIIKIELEGDKLKLVYGKETIPLAHYNYDVFVANENSYLQGMKFTFHMSERGEIKSVSASLQAGVEDIVFKRKIGEGKAETELLQKVVGEYEIMGQVLSFKLRDDGTLLAEIPGQPTYELIYYKGTEFKLKDLEGYSVEFKLDDAGDVIEAVFHQPNGTFPAKRKK